MTYIVENAVWKGILKAPSYIPICTVGQVGMSLMNNRDMKIKLYYANYILNIGNKLKNIY